jgi:hypothetical protein
MAGTESRGPQRFYHGTKAALKPGALIGPGAAGSGAPGSDGPEGTSSHVYLVDTFDAASWQAELSPGEGPGRIYTVEPTGAIEDDPEPADKKYPVPAKSYRSREPLRVTGECTDAQGRPLRFYHGTKADLMPGALLGPGYSPNFGEMDRTTNCIYFTGTLDAATWGAELALGEGPGRIYLVEPTGPLEDDPNLTSMKFPGNPTKSYRSREPLRVTGEVTDWQGHPPEVVKAMKDGIAELEQRGLGPDDD